VTDGLIKPASPEFAKLFRTFDRSAFRLELLQSYAGSGEDAALEAFRNGEPYYRHPGKHGWLSNIDRAQQVGASMSRVHVVVEPLSEYMRYECTWAYAPNVAAGEDVRIISVPEGQTWPASLGAAHDFWLFDDDRLYDMSYSGDEGEFHGVALNNDPEAVAQARRWRDAAWDLAEPWSQWIEQRPELLALLPREARTGGDNR